MKRLPALLFGWALCGCSAFAPSVSEGDDGVGSNTNWFRACDTNAECGEDLGCLCGTCTKACSADAQCGQSGEGACPLDRGAYAAACGPQAALDSAQSACFAPCETSADCPSSRLCVGGGCVPVLREACDSAAHLELESSSPVLRARKGALFGDEFYAPQWYPRYPQDWVEPYAPSTLTARVTDSVGVPVEGCTVKFFADENSGYGFSQDPVTDEQGEVTALWVSGSASIQTLTAAVHSSEDWLFASALGEARAHNEPPHALGPEALDYTAPSGLVVRPLTSEPSREARLTFTPLTFPPGITYVIMDTGSLFIGYTNDGAQDPAEGEVPASDRLLELRIFDRGGESGDVVAILRSGFCSQDAAGFRCAFPDSWQPGETLEVLVQAREVAPGEAPAEYQAETYSLEPCYSTLGCTDFSISTRRLSGEFVRHAVLRAVGIDDLSNRSLYISGVYTPEVGIAPSCLETKRAAFVARHETRGAQGWQQSRGGSSYAFHETWQNQICANYAAFETDDGYYLSTGGPSSIATPSLPGEARELSPE